MNEVGTELQLFLHNEAEARPTSTSVSAYSSSFTLGSLIRSLLLELFGGPGSGWPSPETA